MRARDCRWIVATQGNDGAELQALLRDLGLSVQHACCLHRVSLALEAHPEPTVVVSQLALPDGNWRDMTRLLRRRLAASALVLCVEHLTAELWWDAEEQGVLDVITPPYSQQLVKLVLDPLVLVQQPPESAQAL